MARNWSLLVLLTLLGAVAALTQRKAQVSVRNKSGQPLYNVSVVHKYSSVYRESHTWPVIWDGELAEESMTVQYHTGFLTTGVDWWALAWIDDYNTPYISNPLNFRQIFDFLEKRTPRVIGIATLTAVGIATASAAPLGAVAAAVAAAIASQELTDALFSTETTEGFKQHTLRWEDEDALTEIIIEPNNVITFQSNSGISRAESRALSPRVVPEVDMSRQHEELKKAAEKVNRLQESAPESEELEAANAAMLKSAKEWAKKYDDGTRPRRTGRTRKGGLTKKPMNTTAARC